MTWVMTGEKIPRCSKLQWPESERHRTVSLLMAAGKLTKSSPFPLCGWDLKFNSSDYFSQAQSKSRGLCLLFTQEISKFCTQPIQLTVLR